MAELSRPSVGDEGRSGGLTTGIYVARVISHLDPSFMGSIEVNLLKDQANTAGDDNQTFIVKYASPFFGYTPFEFMGKNDGTKSTIDGFSDTQKSYGMWFVPPDVGVNVLVLFVNGDPASGYWFACVPGVNINHMVPAIAGSTVNSLDAADKKRYGNTSLPLPVAEVNKRINGDTQEIDPEKYPRVVHPIADRFLEQGLLEDDVRGFNTSSPRREAPSMVFGISTPGPLDRRTSAKKQKIGKADSQATVPVSRLGGTQLVMDDGNDRYHRETSAAEGPVKYVDLLDPANQKKGNEGSPTIPASEYFRVRTRTGHQILMHNSEDLIYIANARGTAWIELTSNGKIDIFAEDSISIHTQQDLNIRAARDINLEAGRNINMRTETGKWHVEIATDMEFLVNADAKLTVGANLDILVGAKTKISTNNDLDIASGAETKISSTADISIGSSAEVKINGTKINLNGPNNAETAIAADFVKPYDLRDNPATSSAAGWDKKYQAGIVKSFMKRIPMHEPWVLHEHRAPNLLTPDKTDRNT
jgi:uncharacterized protein (DUF2345 family)